MNARTASVAVFVFILALAASPLHAQVWINEFHYDNASTDADEGVEIAGAAGTDLSGYQIVLYNGANGAVYDTDTLSGAIPDQQSGFGTLWFGYPVNGLQNGAPDGIALVQLPSTVIRFICYEGTFTAVGGPADGMTCDALGVAEEPPSAVGESLQLQGTGTTYTAFTWAGPIAHTRGAINTGQSFTPPPPTPVLSINDVSQDEAVNTMTFTVSLTSDAPVGGVSFTYETQDVSATAPSDYTAIAPLTPGSIPEGSTSTTIDVTIIDDSTEEPDETFNVVISNITNADPGDTTGQGTILNDDISPVVIAAVDTAYTENFNTMAMAGTIDVMSFVL
jgi:hypothetical protein